MSSVYKSQFLPEKMVPNVFRLERIGHDLINDLSIYNYKIIKEWTLEIVFRVFEKKNGLLNS